MSTFGWVAAIFGLLLALASSAAIVYDIYLASNNLPTISKHCADLVHNYPIIAWAIGFVFGVLVGCLAGHLFFPENP